jgi:outer membrane protein OmpA-like peptidoglycan-associated protein
MSRRNIVRAFFVGACTIMMCVAGAAQGMKSVSAGTKFKLKGIIVTRDAETLKFRDMGTKDEYIVELSDNTIVKTYRKGLARGGNEYPSTYLLRGLLIQVEGTGNDEGHVVAREINFDNEDLKTAQALEVRVDPVEDKALKNEHDIALQKANADRMQGQIEENQAATAAARGVADEAFTQANRANTRINGLDTYDPIKTIVVPFATGRFTLGPQGQKIIDEAAAWAKTQDRTGWMVAVVGFADSTGNTATNKTLSEKRSNAVIGYLVSKHNMQLTRLVQPFGAGVDNPVADNSTAAGRAANRRVEIRLMVNKGIKGSE